MQAVAYPEAISLVLPLFQATLPGEPGFQATSYPYPSLTPLGRSESREFEAVTLENEFLRAQWAPGLGGRLVSCVDKRTGEELVPAGIASTSPRGAAIELGIAIEFGGIPRPNDLGPVDVAQLDSEEAAGVVLAETAGGTELSWHLWVRLADDTAALDYEIRVVNRSMTSVAMMPTLRLPAGFAIDERWVRDGKVASSRIHPAELGPNSTAHLTARIIPIGRGETADRSSEHFAVCQRDAWMIYPAQAESVTVLIGTPTQTFEAEMDLDPAQPLVIAASDLPPGAQEIAVRDSAGHLLLAPAAPTEAIDWTPARDWRNPVNPTDWVYDPLLGHVAALYAADQAIATETWSVASTNLERAINSNPENPLAWWRKAALGRLNGDQEDADLPNAHYLAPMEPLLRAEAFLNQSPEMGSAPSPLVTPLRDRPDQLVEVAARWLELGRPDQATRWIDEALRQVDCAMLHYLQAYAFLRARRMEVEIPNRLARAGQIGLQPPYPYRQIEKLALRELHARFPDDATLFSFLSLMA
jgi:hypothetical protein